MAACPVRISFPPEPTHPVVSPEPSFMPDPLPLVKPGNVTRVIPRFPNQQQAKKPEPERFIWDHARVFSLAVQQCTKCRGGGLLIGRKMRMEPCGCVTRKAFNICLGKYHSIQACQDRLRGATPVISPGGRDRRFTWSRKSEEFLADFYLLAKRTLNPQEWGIFNLFMLQGQNWRFCTRELNIDRRGFFHRVYQIQDKLGRVFMETKPYALFPIDQYFGGQQVTQSGNSYRNSGDGRGDGWRDAEKRACKNMTDAARQAYAFDKPFGKQAA